MEKSQRVEAEQMNSLLIKNGLRRRRITTREVNDNLSNFPMSRHDDFTNLAIPNFLMKKRRIAFTSLDFWMWPVSIAALIGVALNIQHSPWSFVIWMATNALNAIQCYRKRSFAQAALFACYFILSIWGIIQWTR